MFVRTLGLLALLITLIPVSAPKGYAMSAPPKHTRPAPEATRTPHAEISQILLSCSDGFAHADALCASLQKALQQRAPKQSIVISNNKPTGQQLAIRLQISKVTKNVLTGQLQWHTETSATQQGPETSLNVVDNTLKPHMFDQLTAALVKTSPLPLD